MRTIVGIYGKQGRGKSTTAKYLLENLPGFVINPLARAVKQEYCDIANISMATLEERKRRDPIIREALQKLGHGKREKNPRLWIDKVLEYPGSMIVDDIRYENEINTLRDAADVFYLIRIETPRDVVLEQDRTNLSHEEHVTETQLDAYEDHDFEIDNSYSLEVLEGQAKWAANDIILSQIGFLLDSQRDIFSDLIGVEYEDEDEAV